MLNSINSSLRHRSKSNHHLSLTTQYHRHRRSPRPFNPFVKSSLRRPQRPEQYPHHCQDRQHLRHRRQNRGRFPAVRAQNLQTRHGHRQRRGAESSFCHIGRCRPGAGAGAPLHQRHRVATAFPSRFTAAPESIAAEVCRVGVAYWEHRWHGEATCADGCVWRLQDRGSLSREEDPFRE